MTGGDRRSDDGPDYERMLRTLRRLDVISHELADLAGELNRLAINADIAAAREGVPSEDFADVAKALSRRGAAAMETADDVDVLVADVLLHSPRDALEHAVEASHGDVRPVEEAAEPATDAAEAAIAEFTGSAPGDVPAAGDAVAGDGAAEADPFAGGSTADGPAVGGVAAGNADDEGDAAGETAGEDAVAQDATTEDARTEEADAGEVATGGTTAEGTATEGTDEAASATGATADGADAEGVAAGAAERGDDGLAPATSDGGSNAGARPHVAVGTAFADEESPATAETAGGPDGDAGGEAGRDAGGAIHRDAGGDFGWDTGGVLDREFGDDFDQEFSGDLDQEFGGDLDPDAVGDPDRANGGDTDRGHDGETGWADEVAGGTDGDWDGVDGREIEAWLHDQIEDMDVLTSEDIPEAWRRNRD